MAAGLLAVKPVMAADANPVQAVVSSPVRGAVVTLVVGKTATMTLASGAAFSVERGSEFAEVSSIGESLLVHAVKPGELELKIDTPDQGTRTTTFRFIPPCPSSNSTACPRVGTAHGFGSRAPCSIFAVTNRAFLPALTVAACAPDRVDRSQSCARLQQGFSRYRVQAENHGPCALCGVRLQIGSRRSNRARATFARR